MGKLVRDKVPDLIRFSGRTPRVTTLTGGAYQAALLDKLREEVNELIATDSADAVIEEAADIIEVLSAIASEWGVSLASIFHVAERKRAERGGFGMRLWLDGIDPDPAGR